MKLTRTKLKGIVKECLLEILSEGIGGKSAEPSRENHSKSKPHQPARTAKKQVVNSRFDRNVSTTVSSLTEDSIMQEILADTARTTLQEQTNHQAPGGAMSIPGPTDNNAAGGINLDGIFGDSNQNWASLAFAEKKNNLPNN